MDLFDIYQHQQIRKAHDRVRMNEDVNEHRHRRSRDEILALNERIDRLVAMNEALWELIAARTGLTDVDLADRLAELDESDGVRDGRRQRVPAECPCGAKIAATSRCCVFCGLDAPSRSPFDSI